MERLIDRLSWRLRARVGLGWGWAKRLARLEVGWAAMTGKYRGLGWGDGRDVFSLTNL